MMRACKWLVGGLGFEPRLTESEDPQSQFYPLLLSYIALY